MKMKLFAASAIAISSIAIGTSASAITVTPDMLIIESDENRGNGSAPGDVVGSADFGVLTGTAGIAGRIVNATDTFTFTSLSSFNLDFVNLLGLDGVDIDDCEGFDGSNCSAGSAPNEDGRTALFSLDDGSSIISRSFTSSVAAGTSIFANVAAGSYTFTIDGTSGSNGSAYDVAISAVPVPAGLPLLLSALGFAGLVRRKKQK